MNNLISDMHIHCGLKGYASENPESTIWDHFAANEEALDKLNFILEGAIKETAKSSQANLDACLEAGLRAPFLALYPIERQMFALDPQRPFRNLFKLLLRGNQHAYLGAAVTGFTIDKVQRILQRVQNDRDIGVDYYQELRKERAYVLQQTGIRPGNDKGPAFQIAEDHDQLQHGLGQPDTICGIFTIEGAHSFGHYLHNSTFSKEYAELQLHERMTLEESMINNITEIKTENDGRHAPFFVTFCHHFNNLLAGHARSFTDKAPLLLGLNKPGMRHLFNQETNLNQGFSSLGRRVLELLLDRKQGRRILIDTKHMSIASREEFYRFVRKKREEENDHIPIVHSHGAVSGWMTLDAAKHKEENHELDQDQFFSRWRINLTNEDILETYDSDGIIGVVLHEGRMPGESFKKEVKKLKKKLKKAKAGSEQENQLRSQLKDMYLKLIWSNIFHIVKVVNDNRQEDGWKLIALGSDYDGLIDPMDSFPEVTNFTDLRKDMIIYLQSGKEICFSQNGQVQPIDDAEVAKLQFGRSAEELLDGILFGNTDRFLKKYFNEAYLGQEVNTEDLDLAA